MTMTPQDLRWMLLVLCLGIFAVVFAVMLLSVWQHHRREGDDKVNFHGSVAVEICWVLAPCVIVLALVWPTVRTVLSP